MLLYVPHYIYIYIYIERERESESERERERERENFLGETRLLKTKILTCTLDFNNSSALFELLQHRRPSLS